MAFADGIDATWSVEDAKGKATSFGVSFPETTDVPTLINNFIPTTAELVDKVINGKIVGAGAVINVSLDGVVLKDSPILGSDVEEGAIFTFYSTEDAPTTFRIPTFDETYGLATGDTVDTTAAPVAAFIALIVDGYTFGISHANWSDSHGNDVIRFGRAKDSFRKRGR